MLPLRILLALSLLLTLPSAGLAALPDGPGCPSGETHGEAGHAQADHGVHGHPGTSPVAHEDCDHGSECQCGPLACPAGGAQAAALPAAAQIEASNRAAPRPAPAGFVPLPPPERSLRPPISVRSPVAQ